MATLTPDWHDFTADYSIPHDAFLHRRRQSNVAVDAIHEPPGDTEMGPAQLYTTTSGRLFHSGKIAIVTVGLPARGKTYAGLNYIAVENTVNLIRPPADMSLLLCHDISDGVYYRQELSVNIPVDKRA